MTTITDIQTPIVYERLWDNRPKRIIEEHIEIIKDLNVDMIFRANWRFNPMPLNCFSIDESLYQICIDSGYSRDQQTQIISEIKLNKPGIIIIGAVPAQKINKTEINELTGETIPDTYYMALDPAKWGITSPTKEELQSQMTKTVAAGGYFPDITNTDFQELFFSWVQEQLMTGVTGIWIDLLYTQAQIMYGYTQDMNHPAVIDSFNAATDIANHVHALGLFVGTWDSPSSNLAKNYGIIPQLDFVTGTPSVTEIQNMTMNIDSWTLRINNVREAFGDIPYFIFIDWAGPGSQTIAFSHLGDKQSLFLQTINDFCNNNGLKFIFPVHGGNLAPGWYDAKAQGTYDAIKSIIQGTELPQPQPQPEPSNKKLIVVGIIATSTLLYLWLREKK